MAKITKVVEPTTKKKMVTVEIVAIGERNGRPWGMFVEKDPNDGCDISLFLSRDEEFELGEFEITQKRYDKMIARL